VSRSSYYRPRTSLAKGPANLDLMRLIDEELLRHPFYGSRKMMAYLNRKGHKVYLYLLKKMSITEPDQVWCSDITYIRLAHGFVYLTAVMDWASRYVLSGKSQ
jgi:putative transposase